MHIECSFKKWTIGLVMIDVDIINVFGMPILVGPRCPKCKALLKKNAKFCSNCGMQFYGTEK